jgi:hypothetical protein
VDLVAQEGGEDASLATGLYPCNGRGHAVIEEHWILEAVIPRLGSPNRCRNHPSGEAGEEAAEGISEETEGISTAAPTPGAVG